MNFLAHLYLAGDSVYFQIGNIMADFVHINDQKSYPPEIIAGILLHRKVDRFTDEHPVFRRSRRRIDPRYRHLQGIMVDLFYDHFLAKYWREYHPEPLEAFSQRIYRRLEDHHHILAPGLQRLLPYMISGNWLVAYRDVDGIEWALGGLSRRMRRKNVLAGGAAELRKHYAGLEGDFREFFPQVVDFAAQFKAPDPGLP